MAQAAIEAKAEAVALDKYSSHEVNQCQNQSNLRAWAAELKVIDGKMYGKTAQGATISITQRLWENAPKQMT